MKHERRKTKDERRKTKDERRETKVARRPSAIASLRRAANIVIVGIFQKTKMLQKIGSPYIFFVLFIVYPNLNERKPTMRMRKILIVHETRILRTLLKTYLIDELNDVVIIEAPSASEALEKFKEQKFEVIICVCNLNKQMALLFSKS
jgi:hypothetical protein